MQVSGLSGQELYDRTTSQQDILTFFPQKIKIHAIEG